MKERLGKIRATLKAKKSNGILVTNHKNIFYLSGFVGVSSEEREALLVITLRRAILIVPEMYRTQVQKLSAVKAGLVQVEVIDQKKGFYGTALLLCGRSQKRIIIESRDLSVFENEHIIKNTIHKIIAYPTLCEDVRMIKNRSEIHQLQKAAKITDEVFSRVVRYLHRNDYTKITEQGIADKMLVWGKTLGADDWAFAPIIASGKGSALPHYHTSAKKLKKNAPLLMDFGFCVNGYNSDMSRTIYLGEAPVRFKRDYEMVRSVQEECAALVCPSVDTSTIDQYARTQFAKSDVESKFIHSLGHGLGLDVHELPFVGPKNSTELWEGMVITIEPGLYFDGKYGIRIEDDVVVTKSGRKILNKSPKELIEIF